VLQSHYFSPSPHERGVLMMPSHSKKKNRFKVSMTSKVRGFDGRSDDQDKHDTLLPILIGTLTS
jgi:hypothetical protein